MFAERGGRSHSEQPDRDCPSTAFDQLDKMHLGIDIDDAYVIPDKGYLTPESCRFDCDEKLLILDAPMGIGKTTSLVKYVREKRPKRALFLHIRQNLANTTADMFSTPLPGEDETEPYIVPSYLDSQFSFERYGYQASIGDTSEFRLSLCIDSLHKIPESELLKGFDLVILDECLFLMLQLTSKLRSHSECIVNLDALRTLLTVCKKVICMQYRVSDLCVKFYRVMCDVDEHQMLVLKSAAENKYLPTMLLNKPEDEIKLQHFAYLFYATNMTPEGLSKPFVIFSTKAGEVSKIYYVLRCIEKKIRPGKPSRILLLTKGTSGRREPKQFMRNPSAHASKYDVVITSPVLQASVSLDTHFVMAIDFFYKNVITHSEEMQLGGRFRTVGRVGLEPFRYSYVERGSWTQQEAENTLSEDQLRSDERISNRADSFTADLTSTEQLAMICKERDTLLHDSTYRHDYIYNSDLLRSNVSPIFPNMDPTLNILWERSPFSREWLGGIERSSFHSRSILNDRSEDERDWNYEFEDNNEGGNEGGNVLNVDESVERNPAPVQNEATLDQVTINLLTGRPRHKPTDPVVYTAKSDDELREVAYSVAYSVQQETAFRSRHKKHNALLYGLNTLDDIGIFFLGYKAVVTYPDEFKRYIENPSTNMTENMQILGCRPDLTFLLALLSEVNLLTFQQSGYDFINIPISIWDPDDDRNFLGGPESCVIGTRPIGSISINDYDLWIRLGQPDIPYTTHQDMHQTKRAIENGLSHISPFPMPARPADDTFDDEIDRCEEEMNENASRKPRPLVSLSQVINGILRSYGIPFLHKGTKRKTSLLHRQFMDCICMALNERLRSNSSPTELLTLLQEFWPSHFLAILDHFRYMTTAPLNSQVPLDELAAVLGRQLGQVCVSSGIATRDYRSFVHNTRVLQAVRESMVTRTGRRERMMAMGIWQGFFEQELLEPIQTLYSEQDLEVIESVHLAPQVSGSGSVEEVVPRTHNEADENNMELMNSEAAEKTPEDADSMTSSREETPENEMDSMGDRTWISDIDSVRKENLEDMGIIINNYEEAQEKDMDVMISETHQFNEDFRNDVHEGTPEEADFTITDYEETRESDVNSLSNESQEDDISSVMTPSLIPQTRHTLSPLLYVRSFKSKGYQKNRKNRYCGKHRKYGKHSTRMGRYSEIIKKINKKNS